MMKRAAFLSAAGGALAMSAFPPAARAAESDITLNTATGAIFGTVVVPAAPPPYPLVLIVAGSGPTDRDGNNGPIRANSYKLLAEALAKSGIASVRYDKRGIGESSGAMPSESALRFDTYVDDAVAWVQLLRADRRFSSVTIAGHSEGALIATIAAQRVPVHAIVLLEGAGRPAPVVLREQLRPQLPSALYQQADHAIAQLQAGRTVANPPPELSALLRPSVQPYLISWFKYDPAAELAKVRVPITIVQGTADMQVTMADEEALAHAAPAAHVVVVTGMNHVLKYFPDTSSPQAALAGYEDPSLPVDGHVITAVLEAAK